MDAIQKGFVELLERLTQVFREKKEASLITLLFLILVLCNALYDLGRGCGEFLYYVLH